MKHIKLFEAFSDEHGVLNELGSKESDPKVIVDFFKKNPKAKQAAGNCKALLKAMRGTGTDEDAVYAVFSKIKTKEELIELSSIWDLLGLEYDKYQGIGSLIPALIGTPDAFTKHVSNQWKLYPLTIKDIFSSWDKNEHKNVNAYYKAREDYYKKNPNMKSTALSYWLKEELDEEELAKVNSIIKKFGMKF